MDGFSDGHLSKHRSDILLISLLAREIVLVDSNGVHAARNSYDTCDLVVEMS
jgi:hypothetical protein